MKKENILIHEKIKRRTIYEAVPILSEVVSERNALGILDCDNIREHVRLLLVISEVFDSGNFTAADIYVFIDTVEKMLGAEKNTFRFVRQLIE